MDRSLHFVLLFAILPFTTQEVTEVGSCQCGVFSRQIQEAIIEHVLPYNFTCNGEGEEKCQQLCVALATASQDKGPQMVCEHLSGDANNLQVAVYTKLCNATSWKFTGLKAEAPICCHEGNSTSCSQPAPVIQE